MVDYVLISWTTFDKRCSSVRCEHVVPEMSEVVWNIEVKQRNTDDPDMMKTRHQFTVVLGHTVSQQISCLSFGKQLKFENVISLTDRGQVPDQCLKAAHTLGYSGF